MALSPIDITPISHYLEAMVRAGATDLMLTARTAPRMRVDGRLSPIGTASELSTEQVEQQITAMLPAQMLDELYAQKELDFSFSFRDTHRFRGNCFFQQGVLALSLRAIPLDIPTFQELRLPQGCEYFCNLPQGLVLVTGPTGSGKSTTLASMIDYINDRRELHILSIEDPIEYVHRHKKSVVNQREVGYDTDTFERALRAALREDPDVILVGEMRDPETIQFALTLAETGHLVFATLHTNDAAQAVDRIWDVFPHERQTQIRVQLAASLAGVISQRLVPKIGGGMVAAFELLIAKEAVRNLVREGKTHQLRNVMHGSRAEGMLTLETSLNGLVADGLISVEEAQSRSLHPREIQGAFVRTA
jgi:twitching motility protein PilT